mgnify:CR=1 FL=1
MLLGAEVSIVEDAFLADAVCHKNLQEMVGDLIELVDSLDVSAHNSFLVLEHPNSSINLHIVQITIHINTEFKRAVFGLLIIEVFERSGYFILALLIENNFENTSVVIDLK